MPMRIARLSQLETQPSLGVTLPDGRRLFLVSVHGVVSAFVNRCPHQQVPLNWDDASFLEAGGELIQCGVHGALFLPETGECVFGPARALSRAAADLSRCRGQHSLGE
ncbi:Rieske (2Fe-2S) protein [Halomonas sp. E19]|uniref:Rieske (2Fe-2S) protein n=1 Tax=Halomonas sp. E19 TaxID=3397247 RepID=UPI004034C164